MMIRLLGKKCDNAEKLLLTAGIRTQVPVMNNQSVNAVLIYRFRRGSPSRKVDFWRLTQRVSRFSRTVAEPPFIATLPRPFRLSFDSRSWFPPTPTDSLPSELVTSLPAGISAALDNPFDRFSC